MRLLPLFFLMFACAPASDDEEEDASTADDDGDGLTNGEEETLGTDPGATDSDGDGWNDGDEVASGTNPAYGASYPYAEGEYLYGNCPVVPDEANAGPNGDGNVYMFGDTVKNIEASDSFGQTIAMYPFCGNYTLITISAEWCGPCQDFAAKMPRMRETIWEQHPNFNFYEVLIQDNSYNLPDQTVLRRWRENFELDTIPVVAPLNASAMWPNQINGTGYIPGGILVAPDMTVAWSPYDNPRQTVPEDADAILAAIDDYLAAQ